MGRLTTVFSAVFLAIGGFLFGYDSGIITSTIALDTFKERRDLGTIINMMFANWMGRRNTIFVGSVVSCIGSALQAGSVNMTMLIIGRFLGGAAVGQLTSTIPMYASELSEASSAPTHLGNPAKLSIGRFPLAFQCVPGIILISGVYFLQESPRWLMERDRHEEARASLNKLRSGLDEETIDLEFREIRDVILADRAVGDVSWKSIITKASWRKRLLLGCGIQAFGPLSGINVINYYGPRIYEILGIKTQESLMIIGISGALSIVYCTIGLWLLDRVGRVKPLIVSAASLGASLLVNAVQAQYINENNMNQLRSMVAMNFVFNMFYTPLGIISWVYPAEIFPVEVRALGNAITTFTNWTVNLVFAQFSPQALTSIGFRYFYVFFVFNLIAMLCYISFFPETKGRTLEQMDELFGDQLVPHAMQDSEGAAAAVSKDEKLVEQLDRV
ncbi:hexose carrier protein [Colletotrichum asianum]|uniref:Hexose carrier protein n=1 Tax=Colletotrichum asianum TaxID=702518 RepID=A0A8H3ZSX6_9PEZI|nr:hexose carrier protein [Colletotrichum asianum]